MRCEKPSDLVESLPALDARDDDLDTGCDSANDTDQRLTVIVFGQVDLGQHDHGGCTSVPGKNEEAFELASAKRPVKAVNEKHDIHIRGERLSLFAFARVASNKFGPTFEHMFNRPVLAVVDNGYPVAGDGGGARLRSLGI